jgi:hypothetical protein
MSHDFSMQDGLIFSFFKKILRFFLRKPYILNLNEEISNQVMFISNHSAVSGPLMLSLFFPYAFIPWGTYEMTEGFKVRFKYLYVTLYQQKLKYPKPIAFFLACFFALLAKMLYKGAKLIPTYPDVRLMKTFRKSEKELVNLKRSLLIFPEDSEQGYHDIMENYHPGFIAFSLYFYKKHGIDLPIYPVYYSKKMNGIVIGKPLFIQSMRDQGLSRKEMTSICLTKTNDLRQELINRYNPKKKTFT